MKCTICGMHVESVEQAILEEWIPLFFEGEIAHGPICSSCTSELLRIGEDGEFELKERYLGKIIYDENLDWEIEPEAPSPDELFLGFILN